MRITEAECFELLSHLIGLAFRDIWRLHLFPILLFHYDRSNKKIKQ